MPSNVARWNGTAWVMVADFDDLAIPEPPIGTNWVFDPAEAGPREGVPTQARFGHITQHGTVGFHAASDGLNIVIAANGQPFQFWQRNVAGAGFDLLGSIANSSSRINNWDLGPSPTHAGYPQLWVAGRSGLSDYTLLAYGNDAYLNAASGGSVALRVANQSHLTVTAGEITGNTAISANFHRYHSRADIYAVNGVSADPIQSRGALSAAGAISGASLACSGDLSGSGLYGTYQLRTTKGGFTNWADSYYLAYGQAGMTSIALHSPGIAPMLRSWSERGEQFEIVDNTNATWRGCTGEFFVTASTITHKKEVRTLGPERERIIVKYEPLSDTVPAPDIMSLRPVVFRPKLPWGKIVPAPGYDEYDPENRDSWESVEEDDSILGLMGRRERLGLIAEEVQYVIPSAVTHNKFAEVQGIDYAQVTVALLEHVQRLTETVETLQYRVAELEGEQP